MDFGVVAEAEVVLREVGVGPERDQRLGPFPVGQHVGLSPRRRSSSEEGDDVDVDRLICCAASSSLHGLVDPAVPGRELRKPPVRDQRLGLSSMARRASRSAPPDSLRRPKGRRAPMRLREGIVLMERLRELRATPFNRFLKGERAFGAEPERRFASQRGHARSQGPGRRPFETGRALPGLSLRSPSRRTASGRAGSECTR